MTSAFDPYLQWLGIRDPQRPPNHYRLLGLELFENDANVIAMSADRQMAHLRNFKTGPEAEVAERLLNELSVARICLLKADRKAAYDNQLRAALKPAVAKAAAAKPAAVTAVKIDTAAAIPTITPAARSSVKTVPAKSAWKPWAILAGLVVLCGGMIGVLISQNKPQKEEKVAVADDTEQPKRTDPKNLTKAQPSVRPAAMTPVTAKSKATESDAETPNDKPETPKTGSQEEPEKSKTLKPLPDKVSEDNSKTTSKEQPASTNPALPTDPTILFGEQVDSSSPEKPENKTPEEEPTPKSDPLVVAQAPAAEPPKTTRIAIPDKATILAKEKEIKGIFAEEYKSQKPDVKAALAAKLRQSSTESKDDSAMRYVLLNESRTNAILGGAVKLAVEITAELVRDYDVPEGDEQFMLFSKLLAGGNRNLAYSQLVVEELRNTLAKLQESDEYEVALKLLNIGIAAARSMRDQALLTELTQRAKELNLHKSVYQRAKIAKETLAKTPDDPAANELWGSYLSFTKGDFKAGLPYLARGTSADLADLASRELANKQAPAEQLELADDWWAYGEKSQNQDAVRSVNIRQHAGQKYVTLFPKLTGIDKAKAEKRINELKKISDQKSKREIDQMMAQLIATKWQVDIAGGAPPEFMVFRPDGTMTNRVFSSWAIENNELVMRGSMIGKIKFNYTGFDVDYYHKDGRLDYQGKARPVAQ